MKRSQFLLLALPLIVGLVAVSPASAQEDRSRRSGTSGGFQMSIHAHSADNPRSPGLLFPTDRLSFNFVQGEDFSYSSRPCNLPAPFNEVGLDFRPDYPGVDDDADVTAPVRHRVQGTVTQVTGDRGTIVGTITTVLCVTQNGQQVESGNVIVTHFEARYRVVSDNDVRLIGRYEISPTESTGTFAGLEGQGSLQAVLTCLAHQRDPSQPTCAQRGHFADFVAIRGNPDKGPGEIGPGLRGTYRDSTIQPV